MITDDKHGPMGPDYDPRRDPRRGVRIRPLPRAMHGPFRRFLAAYRMYCQSHLSTLALAERSGLMHDALDRQRDHWKVTLRALDHIEYLGTTNDPR